MPSSVGPGDESEQPANLPERLGADLPDEPAETLSGEISAEALKSLATLIESSSYEHSGPLPSEHWLREVETIRPGCADLILQDYKAQREHQRTMEAATLDFDRHSLGAFATYQLWQLGIAGLLATLLAVSGLALILLDKPVTGFVLLVGEIAALVLAFYGRRRSGSKSNSEDKPPPE